MGMLKLKRDKTYMTKSGNTVRLIGKEDGDNCKIYLGDDGRRYFDDGAISIIGMVLPPGESMSREFIAENSLVSEVVTAGSLANVLSGKLDPFKGFRTWGENTFGPATPKAIAKRTHKEVLELIEKSGDVWTPDVIEEMADIVLVLTRAPGLWDAMVAKMAVNRSRQWDVKEDGTGYHVPKTDGDV